MKKVLITAGLIFLGFAGAAQTQAVVGNGYCPDMTISLQGGAPTIGLPGAAAGGEPGNCIYAGRIYSQGAAVIIQEVDGPLIQTCGENAIWTAPELKTFDTK